MNPSLIGTGRILYQGVLETLMVSFAMVVRQEVLERSPEMRFADRDMAAQTPLVD